MTTYEEVLNMVGGDYGKLVDLLYGVAELTEEKESVNTIVDKLDRIDDEYLVEKFRSENAGLAHKPLYFVEVGVLLNKDAEEFEDYQINGFYDDKWGFYDENRLAFFDYDEARKYASDYVCDGVSSTYGVVYYMYANLDSLSDRQVREIICSACMDDMPSPDKETVKFFMYKTDDGKLDTLINE